MHSALVCVHKCFTLTGHDVQLLFLNTCQKMINGVGWLDDRHGLSPILYDTAPLFVTLINYCAIVFSFALIFANCWLTACDGFYDASACWLSHMKQQPLTIVKRHLKSAKSECL